jgi:hypothetical protein
MSLEPTTVKPEETQPVEDLTFAQTLEKEMEALVNPPKEVADDKGTVTEVPKAEGEGVPETPVGSEAVSGTDNAPKDVQEEPLPPWAKDLKVEDEDIIEAINLYEKRPSAPWTRTPVHQMPTDKQEKFKAVQRAYDRAYEENRKAKVAPKKDIYESIEETLKRIEADPRRMQAVMNAKNAIYGEDKPVATTVEPIKEDLSDKYSEAVQNGDLKAAKEILAKMVSEEVSRTVPKLKSEILEETEKKSRELTEREQVEAYRVASARIAEREGARYIELLQPIDQRNPGENKMVQVTRMLEATGGRDPITGEQVLSDNPEANLNNVFNYIMSRQQPVGRRIVRTVPNSAQPTSKDTGGKEPELSDADMDPSVPWSDVARKLVKK